MAEFFRGWKPKVGVAALAIAFLVTGGWARSQYVTDFICIKSGPADTHVFMSHAGLMGWARRDSLGSEQFYSTVPEPWDMFSDFEIKSRRRLLGVDAGEGVVQINGIAIRYLLIPDWLVAVPLTFLSAWLLLSAQRKPKPQLLDG